METNQGKNDFIVDLTNIQQKNLKLGYCCINMTLRKKIKGQEAIFCSRTCRLDTLRKNGINYIYELAKKNLKDLEKILKWNYENNITLYRMSSDMLPFASHPEYCKEYDIHQFKEQFEKIGELAKLYNQRLTFHPGQYNQLTSEREDVVKKTIIEIDIHSKIMDYMNIGKEGVIVIHGGSKRGGKDVALKRFKKSFERLSESSRNRLVLENCELSYSVADLLNISDELGIPIVIDYHHHNLNPSRENLSELTEKVIKIWKRRGIIPLFHISESRCGVKESDSITARRAHSDYVEQLPEDLLELIKTEEIHVDVEAKMKEWAVMRLYKKYNLIKKN